MNTVKNKQHIGIALDTKSSIKIQVHNECELKKTDSDGETVRNNPSFNSETRNILHINDFNDFYDVATNKIMESMGAFVQNGSGWNFERVLKFNVYVMEYHPIRVGAYIPTPESIKGKYAVINIKNEDDRCFEYAMLAALHSHEVGMGVEHHVSSYQKWENTLNFDGSTFPMSMNHINKFEKQNGIYVNIYRIDAYGRQILPLYISKQKNQEPINLLLKEGEESNHYCWIWSFDRLLQYNRHPKRFCPYCIHCFDKRYMTSEKFREHKLAFMEYGPQKIKFPEAVKDKLEYKAFDKENPSAFIIYVDFETLLVPIEGCDPDPAASSTIRKTHHQACGYSYVIVSRCTEPKYVTYRGEDAVEHFLQNMLKEEQEIIKFEKKHWT